MKATYAFLCLVFVAKFCYSQEEGDMDEIAKNDPIFKMAKTYFRSNPFAVHFSTFLNHLMHDPKLSNKTLTKRTDSTFFFFQGEYSGYNPYNFKADRVEIRLAEREVTMEDSSGTIDTLFFYQLAGYSYASGGTEAVKKEFSKFDRKFGLHFYSEDSALKRNNETIGMVKNYFFPNEAFLSPVSISWAKLDDLQNVFTITFRIKLAQNMATSPQFPGGH